MGSSAVCQSQGRTVGYVVCPCPDELQSMAYLYVHTLSHTHLKTKQRTLGLVLIVNQHHSRVLYDSKIKVCALSSVNLPCTPMLFLH